MKKELERVEDKKKKEKIGKLGKLRNWKTERLKVE